MCSKNMGFHDVTRCVFINVTFDLLPSWHKFAFIFCSLSQFERYWYISNIRKVSLEPCMIVVMLETKLMPSDMSLCYVCEQHSPGSDETAQMRWLV